MVAFFGSKIHLKVSLIDFMETRRQAVGFKNNPWLKKKMQPPHPAETRRRRGVLQNMGEDKLFTGIILEGISCPHLFLLSVARRCYR